MAVMLQCMAALLFGARICTAKHSRTAGFQICNADVSENAVL